MTKIVDLTITKSDLADYLGVNEASLPEEAERLIKRAKETISLLVLTFDDNNDDKVIAATQAVCAQVEFFIEADESLDILGSFDSFSLSKFSASGKIGPFSPRAKRILLIGGLLYRGVSLRGGIPNENS